MAKILEVGDFIYDDNKTPHNRYEVTAVTAKMCTAVSKKGNKTVKVKREPDTYGRYNFHGDYGGGYIANAEAQKYYWDYVKKENEENKVRNMQYKLRHNTKWDEVPAEKLEAIIKILETN
jgi:hypothetical protein